MQVKCSASTWAQQSSLSSASHLWLGCSQQEFIYQSLSKVEDQQAQTGLSSTTNWAFASTCLRKSQGRLIFLSSSVTVKSLAKGMKHLAALILSDSNHSALEQLEYGFRQNTQSDFSFVGEDLRVLGQEAICCKSGLEEAALYSLLCFKYTLMYLYAALYRKARDEIGIGISHFPGEPLIASSWIWTHLSR